MAEDAPARLRVDKWLWYARFFRTRALAADCAVSGNLRVNGRRCHKPAQQVSPGDELSFVQGRQVRAVRILLLGTRRGPATEAATLFDDLDPPAAGAGAANADPTQAESAPEPATPRPEQRPDKRARREIAALKGRDP
ncbi:MAG: RNA-binding S4 domain-containing protein [Pseudomonadota bacterium]